VGLAGVAVVLTCGEIGRRRVNGAVHVLECQQSRMRPPIRVHETVLAEVAVGAYRNFQVPFSDWNHGEAARFGVRANSGVG